MREMEERYNAERIFEKQVGIVVPKLGYHERRTRRSASRLFLVRPQKHQPGLRSQQN